jgi:uncharacterized protein YbjT (DUF2867 family)
MEDRMPTPDQKDHRILVIGGTGMLGRPIVAALDRAGWKVRVTSRNASKAREGFEPHIELVSANASHLAELEEAMDGCHEVLICVSDMLDADLDARVTDNVVTAAPRLGITRIGLVSGASVDESRRYFPMTRSKYEAETQLANSGIPYFIIRPTWLMESLPRFVRGTRAMMFGKQPTVVHAVAGADVGRMVARAFELDEAVGHTFTIHGPVGHPLKEWIEEYCALTHSGARVKTVPLWMMWIMARLTRNRELAAVVSMMRYFDGLPEFGDPDEANRILGAPTITLREWVELSSPAGGRSGEARRRGRRSGRPVAPPVPRFRGSESR